jgi:hypothetical protein
MAGRIDAQLIGFSALLFSALYLLSDVIEAVHGGFSTGQLWLTLIAEIAVPFFVVGLYLVQRPWIGRLGRLSAGSYAVAYLAFTGSVVYALVNGTSDFTALGDDLGLWMTIPGAIMLIAGIGFGIAVIKAGVLPRWTGATLIVGVTLVVVSQGMPEGPQVVAAAVRDLGFAGMGAALLGTGAVTATPPSPRPA